MIHIPKKYFRYSIPLFRKQGAIGDKLAKLISESDGRIMQSVEVALRPKNIELLNIYKCKKKKNKI